MSMPFKCFRRNQEPEPVHPRVQRPARGSDGADGASPIPDPVLVLTRDLQVALADAAQWKRHANSYAQQRERAVDLLATAYRERSSTHQELAHLLAWLAALHPSSAVITPAQSDSPDGAQVLYLVAGGWQMSWPIATEYTHLFKHVTAVSQADSRAQWDGHGTEQKYERIHGHVRLLALDGLSVDGSMTGVTTEPCSA